MTIEERAELIINWMRCSPLKMNPQEVNFIIEELKDACEEARKQGQEERWFLKATEKAAYEKGFSDAIERAAKTAEPNHKCMPPGCTDECQEAWTIAGLIRALQVAPAGQEKTS